MKWQAILPPDVSVVEGWVHDFSADLWWSEDIVAQRAVPKRRREFAAGRRCARAALLGLGVAPVPVTIGAQRQPLWPGGVVGSITHTDVYCTAAAARESDFAAIGIDAELHCPLPDEVIRVICSEEERRWCFSGLGRGLACEKLFFSAKESLFKTINPLVGANPGFLDIHVDVNLSRSTFRTRAASSKARTLGSLLDAVEGVFSLHAGHIITASWIRAAHCPIRKDAHCSSSAMSVERV